MGIKELRDIYGDDKSITVINRAVRAEIPGGKELFDLLDLLFPKRDDPEIKGLYNNLLKVQQEMRDKISVKYELKTAIQNPLANRECLDIENELSMADDELKEKIGEYKQSVKKAGRHPMKMEKRRTNRVSVRFNSKELELIVRATGDRELAEAIRDFALKGAEIELSEQKNGKN